MSTKSRNQHIELENDGVPICKRCRCVTKVGDCENYRYIDVYINSIQFAFNLQNCKKTKEAVVALPENKQEESPSGEHDKMSTTQRNTQEYINSRHNVEDNFDSLPDEVILQIFQRLPQNQLGNVASVCRRFKHIVEDESLWEMIDASRRVINPDSWRGIMGLPVKILRLVESKIDSAEIRATYPDDLWRLIHLDLTGAQISQHTLTGIFNRCRNLKRLSLAGVRVSDGVIVALSGNKDLEVLKLARTFGITVKGIRILLVNCRKLKELNLADANLSLESIRYVCKNIPSSLIKFNISGCRDLLQNEHVEEIVKNCPHLQELDLSHSSSLTLNVVPILQTLNELTFLNIRDSWIAYDPFLIWRKIRGGVYWNVHASDFERCARV